MEIEVLTKNDLTVFGGDLLKEFIKIISGQPKDSSKKWLKTKDLEKLYGISIGKQQMLRNDGTLPFSKLGGVVYYSASDIDSVLESNKIK